MNHLATIAGPLGWYYLIVAAMNVGMAWCVWRCERRTLTPVVWLVVAILFSLLSWRAFGGHPMAMPESAKRLIDSLLGPVTFTLGSFALFTLLFLGRRYCVRPGVAWAILNVSLLFLGASMTDSVFASIVGKPDNVPIVAMVYLLGIFTWLGAYQAVKNDRRLEQGEKPLEAEYSGKVLAWPDLVYVELIGTILATVVLVVWSLLLIAPLEEPANPVLTPNPSKAPWYFLGLQELLGYFDPSIAGVILPGLIILGLMAIPYLDFNPKGNGYYTIDQRKFGYLVFQFGFLQLWILLILIGTFMRGPNWSFFGLYEPRDPHKVIALSNISLSERFWVLWLGMNLPTITPGSGLFAELGTIVWREIAGIVVLSIYFILLPLLLSRTLFRTFRQRMSLGRYTIMTLLLLMMLMLPIKMVLRWTLNMSYLVSIPEYFFNF